MPIDGLERVNFQVTDHSQETQKDQASDVAADVLKRLRGKAQEVHAEKSGSQGGAKEARAQAPKFEGVLKGLLGGAQGAEKQQVAQLMNTPVFQKGPNGAKEEVTEKIANGQIGYETASSFGKLTGDPKADAALNSAEASGAVMRAYAQPKNDLKKVEGAVQEFIENFSGGAAGSDPKANAKMLNANLQKPGNDILGLMNKGLGNKSLGGKDLSGTAKEAIASRALKEAFSGMKPGESVTGKIMQQVNDPNLMKKLGNGEMSKLAMTYAKTPQATVPLESLLKNEKFFNMSSKVREGQVAFIGMQSNIGAFKGKPGLGATLTDKLSTLPREAKQMKALNALLAKKGEVDDDDLDEAISRARRKAVTYPEKREYDANSPDHQKEMGAELAQWMQLKQKTLQANRKLEQRVQGCKTGADLKQLEPLKSWQNLDVSDRPPEIQAAVQKMNQEIEQELKKQRLTYSKQMKLTRGVKADASAVKERAPTFKPVKTTFRLPDDAGGVNTTFSISKLVSTESTTATKETAAVTTTTTTAAPKINKNSGWGVPSLGIDRDRQFFSKTKSPDTKGAKVAGAPGAAPKAEFKKGGEVRKLDELTQHRWIDLSVKERGDLRTLQIDRRVFETLATQRPTVPALMLKGWGELNRAQQSAASELGMSDGTWNANRERCASALGSQTPKSGARANVSNVQFKRNA